MFSILDRILAREVLDSRGNPTVEVEVHCAGARGRAIVPSGASTGKHEALELRDGGSRYAGRGVAKAVAHVNHIIAPKIKGMNAGDQAGIDRLLIDLDGTPNKSRLGANAILGVSLACAHAAAAARGIPLYRHFADLTGIQPLLPLPMINMISGGLHAGGNLDFQDFLFLPIAATSFSQALEMSVAVYRRLGEILARQGYESALVGDEGGYGPKLGANEQALRLLTEAMAEAGYQPGSQGAIAIDVASTHFYRDGQYHLRATPTRHNGSHRERAQDEALSPDQCIDLLTTWVERYPILSIEDPLAEDDWPAWQRLTARLGNRLQLIGDDLFATNVARLQQGIQQKVANSVLVKVNQIGTLTETLQVIQLARAAGYAPVVSARSGETEDTTIADLAVGTAAGQIKIGSITRGERLAKYNQLLRIEEQLGQHATFAGKQALRNA